EECLMRSYRETRSTGGCFQDSGGNSDNISFSPAWNARSNVSGWALGNQLVRDQDGSATLQSMMRFAACTRPVWMESWNASANVSAAVVFGFSRLGLTSISSATIVKKAIGVQQISRGTGLGICLGTVGSRKCLTRRHWSASRSQEPNDDHLRDQLIDRG